MRRYPPIAPALLLLLLLLPAVTCPAGAAEPPVRIEMELATEDGFPISATQRWYKKLIGLGVDGLRIRRLRAGDSLQPSTNQRGSSESPSYTVFGILTRRGALKLPGATFTATDSVRLKSYLEKLRAEGPERLTEKKDEYGLTANELETARQALSQPLPIPTLGKRPGEILESLRARTGQSWVVDPAASTTLDSAEPITVELDGLATGTAVAALLRKEGLLLQPVKVGRRPVEFVVSERTQGRDGWPVGWPTKRSPRELVPAWLKMVNVEIEGYTLDQAMAAIHAEIPIPLLWDEWSMAREEIDPAEIQVRLPATRTFYKRVLDRILFQARLKVELRTDDAGQPLMWVTTLRAVEE